MTHVRLFVFVLCFATSILVSSERLLGGWSEASPNDEMVREAAQFAHDELERRTNSLYASRLVDTVRARKQVTSAHAGSLRESHRNL